MARHGALQPLSREHFNGLVQARRLTKAADEEVAERARRVSDFAEAWRGEIEPHFDDEERLLLPVATPRDGARLLAEHGEIRELAAAVIRDAGDADRGRLRQLGRRLHDHIRWEERCLFPKIEAAASAAQMARIAERTLQVEVERPGARRRSAGPKNAEPGGPLP